MNQVTSQEVVGRVQSAMPALDRMKEVKDVINVQAQNQHQAWEEKDLNLKSETIEPASSVNPSGTSNDIQGRAIKKEVTQSSIILSGLNNQPNATHTSNGSEGKGVEGKKAKEFASNKRETQVSKSLVRRNSKVHPSNSTYALTTPAYDNAESNDLPVGKEQQAAEAEEINGIFVTPDLLQDDQVELTNNEPLDGNEEETRKRRPCLYVMPFAVAVGLAIAALGIPLAIYMANDCVPAICLHGGSCGDEFLGNTCYCPNGYSGERCEENIDECASNPCENNATCIDGIDEFLCNCQPGYTDILCQVEIDECESDPCLNDANCTDSVNRFDCDCALGFTGVTCETNIDECISTPCINGACFQEVETYGYFCICDSGYTGLHCEENIDECASSPCEGSSECIDQVNSFDCVCEDGLFGTTCEFRYSYIYECCSDPCENGGECNQMINYYTCACAEGFTGTHCETNIDECASSPCENGGICVDGVARYDCNCPEGFEGTHCEYQSNDIIVILDASSSMSTVNPNVQAVMTSIINRLSIGQFTSRVALVSWNCAVYRHWDFTSANCYDSTAIQNGIAAVSYDCAPGTSGWSTPYAAFVEARDILRAQNRNFARNFIIYVSDGLESTDNADWVRNTLGASEHGSESARILLIGTTGSGTGWNQLILFNNDPNDRWDFSQANVAQEVADTIQN